ncbi:alpha/beta fold hydrolase [Zhihengliuella flava]|uniref:Pimeloyl-ACP methyl ester carboxylesterase n=1 Tax=Zhihengliuella flava TaxID=1285193 RepID=A0A931D7C2_9MICC|nr:alpha/beta hydrolase [Zhihengliuella flava]MBG6083338.1 pimeloyl-ACP methyl ester carboxylesterase [Zhihengliuella flava]
MTSRSALVSTHVVDGATVRCWTYPAVTRTSSPPPVVVGVHGFRGDHHGLERIVAALPDRTIVIPDLPGFGASSAFGTAAPTPTHHDVPGYARVIAHITRDLDVPSTATLLGHSFGSLVAAHDAAARPEAWARLVLINPISEPALEGSEALLSRAALLFYRVSAVLPERFGVPLLRARLITDLMSATMTKSPDPALRDFVRSEHRRYFGGFTSRTALVEAFNASITRTVLDDADRLKLPTLLLAGALDELGSPASQRALAARITGARLEVYNDVGHLIHYESPARAADAIRAFTST